MSSSSTSNKATSKAKSISASTSTNSNKANASTKRFEREYSKALAKALLDNEQQQKAELALKSKQQFNANYLASICHSPFVSMEDVNQAYRSLCYDDPIVNRVESCSALAYALLSSSFLSTAGTGTVKNVAEMRVGQRGGALFSKLSSSSASIPNHANGTGESSTLAEQIKDPNNKVALSNRLVQGIVHASSRPTAATSATTSINGANAKGSEKKSALEKQKAELQEGNFQSYLNTPITSNSNVAIATTVTNNTNAISIAGGYAELAYVAFAVGPLYCCQDLLQQQHHKKDDKSQNTIDQVTSFLGSYHYRNPDDEEKESDTTTTVNTNGRTDVNTEAFLQSMTEMTMHEDNDQEEEKKRDSPFKSSSRTSNSNEQQEEKQQQQLDYDSMEEIFADESDPDDFDFNEEDEEGGNTTNTMNGQDEVQTLVDSFNPQLLSKPPVSSLSSSLSTMPIIKRRMDMIQIQSLLQQLSYSRLAPMTPYQWREWNVSSTLAELTLTLLKFASPTTITTTTTTITTDENNLSLNSNALSTEFTKPLFLLQDRVMSTMNKKGSGSTSSLHTHDDDSFGTYISLIQTLLSSKECDVGEYASKNRDDEGGDSDNHVVRAEISPARSVGISSLANVCRLASSSSNMTKPMNDKIRNVILHHLDDFIDCIEHVRPTNATAKTKTSLSFNGGGGGGNNEESKDEDKALPTWVRLTMALLPILDFLTGIQSRSDYSPSTHNSHSTSSSSISTTGLTRKESQSLLQTGLFRELILLYTRSSSSDNEEVTVEKLNMSPTNATTLVREQILSSILIMAAQSPNILGKYVARVPDLTKLIYKEMFLQKYVVDAVFWYALLSFISTSSTTLSTGTMRLRKKGTSSLSNTSAHLTTDELNKHCLEGTINLFQQCTTVLLFQQESENNNNDNDNNNKDGNNFKVLSEFLRFSNCCLNVSTLREAWGEVITNQPNGKTMVQEALTAILKSLSKVATLKNSKEVSPSKATTTNNDDDDDSKKKKGTATGEQPQSDYGVDSNTIASMRKEIKSILLLVENFGNNNEKAIPTRQGSHRLSSKTD